MPVIAALCVKNESVEMDIFSNIEVKKAFSAYPDNIRTKMMYLRQLVLETAAEIDSLGRRGRGSLWLVSKRVRRHGTNRIAF